MLKLVLLDFDDTLCLSEESCFHFENKIAQSMGFSPMSRTIHQITWGQNLKDAILERIPGIDNEEFMRRFEASVPQAIQDGLFDSVPERNLEVLDKLKQAEKKIAILTSRSLGEVEHLLHQKHPLHRRVDAFYHSDNVEHLKPDPRVFNNALYQFNVLPRECIYIGDSPSDAVAAKGADMHFIAVLESGLRTKEDFSQQEIDLYVDKFTDILPYILSH